MSFLVSHKKTGKQLTKPKNAHSSVDIVLKQPGYFLLSCFPFLSVLQLSRVLAVRIVKQTLTGTIVQITHPR